MLGTASSMILVALGSNMHGPWGDPAGMLVEALRRLNAGPLRLVSVSRVIDTDPFGRKNQPRFVNAVAIIVAHLPPQALLKSLHNIERAAGRKRKLRWGPRTLDLDLIDYHGRIINTARQQHHTMVLPHPGIAQRRFVLEPILEIAPTWRHPKTRKSAREMLSQLRDV